MNLLAALRFGFALSIYPHTKRRRGSTSERKKEKSHGLGKTLIAHFRNGTCNGQAVYLPLRMKKMWAKGDHHLILLLDQLHTKKREKKRKTSGRVVRRKSLQR